MSIFLSFKGHSNFLKIRLVADEHCDHILNGATYLKVAFFRKCNSFFKSPDLQKNLSQKAILGLEFKFFANNTLLLLTGNLYFKFMIVFWNIFFGDLKNTKHFLKKRHL